jgi:hypothetical protein
MGAATVGTLRGRRPGQTRSVGPARPTAPERPSVGDMPDPDLAAARELAHRYAAAVDEGLIAAAVALFTPEAVLRLPDPPRHLRPVSSHRGHDEIRSALGAVLGLRATVHEITGQVLDRVDAIRVRGRTTCAAHHFLAGPDGERTEAANDLLWRVRYDDEYVLHDGHWSIAERSMTVLAVELRPVRALLPRDTC